MRNDALDELETVPSLTTDARDRNEFSAAPKVEPVLREPLAAAGPGAPVKAGPSTGPLWALLGAALIAIGMLGWWGMQQIALLNQQLIATQESFAQISEDAAGRIKDISGKVVATESNVTSESESLKLRVKQLETQLADVGRKQQSVSGLQGEQSKQLESLVGSVQGQKAALQQADNKLQKLSEAQAQLKTAQAEVAKLDTQLKAQNTALAALKQQTQGISRLEQDVLVLRSELDGQAAQGSSTAEFDAFRAQMTRNLTTLQTQIHTLQQQLNAPR